MEFKAKILQRLVSDLELIDNVLAVWEGGSAANKTSDEFSDIDFNILAGGEIDFVFRKIEESLNQISEVTHVWNEPKSVWPDLTQKIYFLKDSPKHFFVDVAVFPKSADKILAEFLQVERHGKPIVYFDKSGMIIGGLTDKAAILQKQMQRLAAIVEAFPVYRTEVFKELDRGHSVDSFAFFHSGMLRPLIEVLGILHRPVHFDFGFRYLKRSFPAETFQFIENCLFVKDLATLRKNAEEVEKLFYQSVEKAKDKLQKDL